MTFESESRAPVVEVVVATGNPGKLSELRDLLGEGFVVTSAGDHDAILPEETGSTFAENALLKATAVAEQTGKIAIADDSGLEVDHLDGAPGVQTARYAGAMATDAENRRKLLHALEGIAPARRRARFVSVISVAITPADVFTTRGTIEGHIAAEERGTGGFGYDAIFEIASGRTMAEIAPSEKNAISHRGQAMREAVRLLRERLAAGQETPT